jgi:hypothetical protein
LVWGNIKAHKITTKSHTFLQATVRGGVIN